MLQKEVRIDRKSDSFHTAAERGMTAGNWRQIVHKKTRIWSPMVPGSLCANLIVVTKPVETEYASTISWWALPCTTVGEQKTRNAIVYLFGNRPSTFRSCFSQRSTFQRSENCRSHTSLEDAEPKHHAIKE